MTKHRFVVVLFYFYTLVYVSSAPLSSVEPLCDRYPFACLSEKRYTGSNTNHEELDYETAMILNDSAVINYVQRQVADNTPYERDDVQGANFEMADVEDSDYDDGDKIYDDIGEVDEQGDNYNDGESFDDGLFFEDATPY